MPTDKLIEQRIREKNETLHMKEASDENEKSTNKMSMISNHKKQGHMSSGHGVTSNRHGKSVRVAMRKADKKLYRDFLEMLKQYKLEDGLTILEDLTQQFRDEYEDEEDEIDETGGVDEVGEEEDQIEQEQSEDYGANS